MLGRAIPAMGDTAHASHSDPQLAWPASAPAAQHTTGCNCVQGLWLTRICHVIAAYSSVACSGGPPRLQLCCARVHLHAVLRHTAVRAVCNAMYGVSVAGCCWLLTCRYSRARQALTTQSLTIMSVLAPVCSLRMRYGQSLHAGMWMVMLLCQHMHACVPA